MPTPIRVRNLVMTFMAVAALSSCSSDSSVTGPPPPPPPPPGTVLLKDIVIPRLPSPFYHFEYDAAGRVSGASFASGLAIYDVVYDAGRISELRNKTLIDPDRLIYVYDDAGRVALIKYTHADGVVFTTVFFTYTGEQLTKLERDRAVTGGFIIDKTMSFTYDADGNLFELTDHRPAIAGFQDETTTIDRYEQYDNKINVDAFGLIHNDFFDQLVLLPAVQLQKGNPARLTHTGDGDNYTVNYTYGYDARSRPLTSSGDLKYSTGPHAGEHFALSSAYSYYD